MSDVWHPLDPEGSRPPEVSGREQGPDPEPIVRTVRVAFLLAGMVVAVMVNAGLNGLGGPSVATSVGRPAVTAVMAVAVLAVLGGAWLALRPARLLTVGKRALAHPDPRQRRPRAERARAIGFRGLAMGWAGQALVFGLLPVGAAGLRRDQPARRLRVPAPGRRGGAPGRRRPRAAGQLRFALIGSSGPDRGFPRVPAG